MITKKYSLPKRRSSEATLVFEFEPEFKGETYSQINQRAIRKNQLGWTMKPIKRSAFKISYKNNKFGQA